MFPLVVLLFYSTLFRLGTCLGAWVLFCLRLFDVFELRSCVCVWVWSRVGFVLGFMVF